MASASVAGVRTAMVAVNGCHPIMPSTSALRLVKLQPRCNYSCLPARTRSQATMRSSSAIYANKRHASTSTTASSTSTTPAMSADTTASVPPTSNPVLDWNTFFKLRNTRRHYQLGSSVTTSLAGFLGAAQVLMMVNMDSLVSWVPLDPFMAMGLATFASGAAGWLAGPVVGTALFNMQNRKVRPQMQDKERAFFHRIKKWRVDPSGGSASNPVPDYYGEKIGSVAGYRQWLKDQRAFNRKRQNYL